MAKLKPPIWDERKISSLFILGTDRLGRDILSNIIHGLRISLLVDFFSVGISMLISIVLGLTAGYARGFWKSFIMRAMEVQHSLPSIGLTIARGYQVLFSGSWWASIFPSLALMLLVAFINIIADWLRDGLEPRSREQVLDVPPFSVHDLKIYFPILAGTVRPVDGISFYINEGETLGVVGESGCGKSVTAFALLQLIPMPPGELVIGRAEFAGQDLLQLNNEQIRKIKGNCISMIFQEPMTSLNPAFTIGNQIK